MGVASIQVRMGDQTLKGPNQHDFATNGIANIPHQDEFMDFLALMKSDKMRLFVDVVIHWTSALRDCHD